MSDSSAKETASPVSPDTTTRNEREVNPAWDIDVKHKETSSSSSRSTTPAKSQQLAHPAALSNTAELSPEAQSTFVNTANLSTPPSHGSAHDGEKHTHRVEENDAPKTIRDAAVKEGEVAESTANTNAEDDVDVEVVFPGGLQLGLLTFGLCMATFTVALDNTIIATAIPRITTVFDSLPDVGWYGSSYLLTTTALQPSFGRIYTYFNVKYTYLFALCLFELGSIICAAANGSVMLIIGRAVAGAGASALFSGGRLSYMSSILNRSFWLPI
jgi:hypothetical protein